MSYFVDKNYYELLEVTPGATPEEIKSAFLRAKNIYSPESPALYTMFTKEEATELTKMLDEAYNVLSNYAKRREYDRALAARGVNGFSPKPGPAFVAQNELPDFFNTDGSIKNIDSSGGNHSSENAAVVIQFQADAQIDNSTTANSDDDVAYTRFSQYQIDPILEAEIKVQEVFDGTFLRKIRMYKNLDLDRVCEVSKIGKHHIICIENNEFEKLPAKVFVRGFVRHYAEILQLPINKVVESYMKLLKESRGDK